MAMPICIAATYSYPLYILLFVSNCGYQPRVKLKI